MELPVSHSGDKYLVVAVDVNSRFMTASPIKNKEAATVAAAFHKMWFNVPGLPTPQKVLSDQGTEFLAEFRTMLQQHGVRRINTTAYHPQGDGIVERANQTLQHELGTLASDRRDWPSHVQHAVDAFNMAEAKGTGFPPLLIMKGEAPRIATEPTVARPVEPSIVAKAQEQVRDLNVAKQAKTDALMNNTHVLHFKQGQRVWVRDLRVDQEPMNKLLKRWIVCTILKKRNPCTYSVQAVYISKRDGSRLTGSVHVRNIKAFTHRVLKPPKPVNTVPLESLPSVAVSAQTPIPIPFRAPVLAPALEPLPLSISLPPIRAAVQSLPLPPHSLNSSSDCSRPVSGEPTC